jgi:CRP-like cAMP-binding protein
MADTDVALLRRNLLLDALDDDALEAVAEVASYAPYDVRDVIYEIGEPVEMVLFPTDGVFSLVTVMDDGRSVEVGTVGREGFVGVPVLLEGSFTSEHMAFCQLPGEAVQIRVPDFQSLLGEVPTLRSMLHRYTLALLAQIAQASACNRLHRLEHRCARWLLMTHDRVYSDEFPLTQEFLGQMLGVPSGEVTAAQEALAAAGLISYMRGSVTVLDRPGLERQACECYDLIRAEHERLAAFDPAAARS